MNLNFRHSIRFKIASIVFLTTLVTILISWYISNYFIQQFYVSHTQNMLVTTYNSCKAFFADEDNLNRLKNGELSSLYEEFDNPAGAKVYVINPRFFNI